MKLKVVDETEDRARALGMQVLGCLGDDYRVGKTDHGEARGTPGLGSRCCEPERLNLVAGIIGVARNAVWGRWARTQDEAVEAEVRGSYTGARKERHGRDGRPDSSVRRYLLFAA